MSIVCLASLKGGVGKTSLSVNLSHALATRGCRSLLIDLDPAGHATRLFRQVTGLPALSSESPLARHFLPRDVQQAGELGREGNGQIVEGPSDSAIAYTVRPDLDIVSAGQELRHFLWGRGAQVFARRFPALLKEYRFQYDYIIIDTPPDFNILTRNAIATSDLVLVPVDSSEMSIHSLEELLLTAQHIRRPTWAIVRTMVNKQAARTSSLSASRLKERLAFQHPDAEEANGEANRYNIEDPKEFIRMLQDWEEAHGQKGTNGNGDHRPPLYLLRALIYRTEQQNQLSFSGRTAFDLKSTAALANQYRAVAKEIESLIATDTDEDEEPFNQETETNETNYTHERNAP